MMMIDDVSSTTDRPRVRSFDDDDDDDDRPDDERSERLDVRVRRVATRTPSVAVCRPRSRQSRTHASIDRYGFSY